MWNLAGAQAAPLPETCDAIEAFEPEQRYFFDKRHRAVVRADQVEAADVRNLEKVQAAVRKKHGEASAPYAIISYDLEGARAALAESDNLEEATATRSTAQKPWIELLNKTATTKAEIDTLASIVADLDGSNIPASMGTPEAARLGLYPRHRAAFGPQERQASFLQGNLDGNSQDGLDPIELHMIGKTIAAIGQEINSDRVRYDGQVISLAGLVAQERSNEAKLLAEELLPVAEERMRWSLDHLEAIGEHGAACWLTDGLAHRLIETVEPTARLGRLDMMETVLFQELSHGIESWYPFTAVLRSRELDPAAFREALRVGAIKSDLGDSEIDYALAAANDLNSASEPDLAFEYLNSAALWAADSEPRVRFQVLLQLADLEWKSGAANHADELVDELSSIVSTHPEDISNDAKSALLAFQARIAETRLKDFDAASLISAAVETFGNDEKAEENSDAAPLIQDLLSKHLRGRFCVECGQKLVDSIDAWSGVDPDDYSDDELIYAVMVLLSESPSVGRTLLIETETLLRGMIKTAANNGYDVRPGLKKYRRIAGSKERALSLAAIDILLGQQTHLDMLERTKGVHVPAFIQEFLTSDSLEEIRSRARDIVDGIYDSELEFSGAADAIRRLDILVGLLGYADKAQQATEINRQLIRYAEMEESGQAYFDRSDKLALADELARAYARSADEASRSGAWTLANEHATKAIDLIRSRLQDEWRTGNERAILLYRTFQPAIKQAAEVRLRMATIPDARSAVSGLQELAFSDMQLAMLGETAFAAQAATQARLLHDEAARDALRRRDTAAQSLRRIEALERQAPATDPKDYARRQTAAAAVLAAAEQRLDLALPGVQMTGGLDPVTLESVQSTLSRNEALLVLHVSSGSVFGMSLRSDGPPAVAEITLVPAELSDAIAQLRREVASFGTVDLSNAHGLYGDLVEPFVATLGGVDHLNIVADGHLAGMPWAALVTSKTDSIAATVAAPTRSAVAIVSNENAVSSDWSSIPWLVKDYSIALAPSVTSLVEPIEPSEESRLPFLGIGDPVLTGDKGAQSIEVAALNDAKRGTNARLLSTLAPLPETATELATVAAALGASNSDILVGMKATESMLKARSLDRYRIISFATHGILAGEIGGYAEPGLVLTAEDVDDPARDGYLALSEIASLKLRAELVILSACNTGAADGRPRAEWMSGLTKGFLSAGANRLLVTLWSIPSDPTVRLITGMVERHQATPRDGWAKALQRSTLAMLERPGNALDSHPASWAGFVLYGRTGAD